MTMTRAKRNAEDNDTMPPQPSPNPKAKKKNKEGTLDESLDGPSDAEAEKTENDPIGVVNLVSKFDKEAVAGTVQLWTQPILPPTAQWKNVCFEGELTGFSADEIFGEGDTIHSLARLGKIIRELGALSSLTAAGWATLFQEAFTSNTALQKHKHLERLKTFAI